MKYLNEHPNFVSPLDRKVWRAQGYWLAAASGFLIVVLSILVYVTRHHALLFSIDVGLLFMAVATLICVVFSLVAEKWWWNVSSNRQ